MTDCGNSRVLSNATRDAAVRKVADVTGIHQRDIMSRSRIRAIYAARAQAMHDLRAMGYSFPQIGRAFGMDHTTVMHAVGRAGV